MIFFTHFGNIVWQLFDAKRHVCEIGQCFWELYLIKRICTFQVHILVYFKYVRPNLIIIFSLFSFCGIKKRAGLLFWWFFFLSLFFFTTVFSGQCLGCSGCCSFNSSAFFCFVFGVQSLFTKLCTTEIMNAIRWWNAL